MSAAENDALVAALARATIEKAAPEELPLFPATGEPFPVAGGTFGDQVCFPLPAVERLNNPNIPD